MDIKDTIKQLSDRVTRLKDQINTEEATKNAFIMPFIQLLGYDVFNPIEVVPEMVCDIGTKKGEKIDYAIVKDGEPIILIECKHWKQDLNLHDNQLLRYFHVSKAKFGILTNGIKYRFYTDLIEANKMDEKPFLEVDLENIKENQIEEIKKFHKSYFDIEAILSSASELKYTSELKSVLSAEFKNPSPELVKLLAKKVYDGLFTLKVQEQFAGLIKKAIANHINDIISDRLNIAIKTQVEPKQTISEETIVDSEETDKPRINTTQEEMEGFYIIKSILRNSLDVNRITHRDSQTYFAILIDDNNRKGICRLYFNSENNKRIAIIDENKKETFCKITSLDDIYQYQDDLIKSAERFL